MAFGRWVKDEKVKTTANDASPGYLSEKVDALRMVVNGDLISVRDYASYPLIEWRFAIPTATDYPEQSMVYIDGKGIWRNKDDGTGFEPISAIDHTVLLNVGENDHHSKSHSHTVADGSGAIATDQPLIAGDGGTTNYVEIDTGGALHFYGTAVYKKTFQNYGYNIYGATGTYNGLSLSSSDAAIIDGVWYCRTFGYGGTTYDGEVAICTFKLPDEYIAGSDITFRFSWTAPVTSGDVSYGVGVKVVGNGEIYDGNATYVTAVCTAPDTEYKRQTETVVFSGLDASPNDDIGIVLYRYYNDSADTLSGNAYLTNIEMEVLCNRLGGDG